MPTPRNRLAPSPIEDNPVGWESIYPPPPGRVITNPSPEFSPLAPSTYMTAAQKVGRFFNAATGRAKPYTVADLLGLTQAGNEAYDAAAGFVNSTNPIRAYHGSPHTFDRFDMSKIGTGEGAQAYGHGLYFAGREGVARSYRDTLSALKDPIAALAPAEQTAYQYLQLYNGDRAKAVAQLAQSGRPSAPDAIKIIQSGWEAPKTGGSMYEVNLRTSPERLLDWDKPLSQQPAAVREALANTLPPYEVKNWGGLPHAVANKAMIELPKGEVTGREAYILSRAATGVDNSREAAEVASNRLRDLGIPGLQYLDGGSRAAGDGSRNYVMFRDDIIDILKRYGLLGMIGGGGAAARNRLAPQGEQ